MSDRMYLRPLFRPNKWRLETADYLIPPMLPTRGNIEQLHAVIDKAHFSGEWVKVFAHSLRDWRVREIQKYMKETGKWYGGTLELHIVSRTSKAGDPHPTILASA